MQIYLRNEMFPKWYFSKAAINKKSFYLILLIENHFLTEEIDIEKSNFDDFLALPNAQVIPGQIKKVFAYFIFIGQKSIFCGLFLNSASQVWSYYCLYSFFSFPNQCWFLVMEGTVRKLRNHIFAYF